MLNEDLICRVCGYESDTPQWGTDGKTPTYEFCPCCGVEHGYQDCQPISARRYREAWIQSGANWEEASLKPLGWVLEDQLMKVPIEFR